MKKIFMVFAASATVAVALNSCNNAAEVAKQTEEQNAKIQNLVDEKFKALEAEVAAECDTEVAALAQAQFDSLAAAATPVKGVKPAAKKPVAKPTPKKEEPKKPETKSDKMGGTSAPSNGGDKSSKMGGTTTTTPATNKASKMGGN